MSRSFNRRPVNVTHAANSPGVPSAQRRSRERANGGNVNGHVESKPRNLERLKQLSRQARQMAHDFRNLLFVADTRAEMAQMDVAGNSNAQQSLSAIRAVISEAREMTTLLEGLAQDLPLDGVPTNLGAVINNTILSMRGVLPDSIQLIEDVRIDPPIWIRGDSVQLSRLIRNLILNARDAMVDGGVLSVTLDAVADQRDGDNPPVRGKVRLEIADTGSGMGKEIHNQVFEPFFTTKRDRGGTGLGLPIVKEIAEAHSASIQMESASGAGTRFRITFPALHRKSDELGDSCLASGMVLVVGADESLRASVAELIADDDLHAGYADTAWQALHVLERDYHAVQCIVIATGALPAEDVAMLRALRSWRGRRGVVLLVPPQMPGGALITSRDECVLTCPYSAADFRRSVKRGMHSAN